METQQPDNRITIEQAKAIVDAINPGLEKDDEDDYDLEYQDWEE